MVEGTKFVGCCDLVTAYTLQTGLGCLPFYCTTYTLAMINTILYCKHFLDSLQYGKPMCKISRWILAVCHLASNLTTYVYVLIGYQNLSYPYDPSSCLHVKDTCNGVCLPVPRPVWVFLSQSPDLCGCAYPSPQTYVGGLCSSLFCGQGV